MRRKIYPIAIIFSLPLVVIIFFIINQGRFEQHSPISTPSEKGLYLEYDIEWQGFGKPKIESIEIIDETGDIQLEQLNTSTFIQQLSEDNNLKTEDVVKENYLQASDYEVNDSSFRLVFHIDDHHKDNLASVQTLTIRYKTFGISKEQQIKVERNSWQ